jgi:hypothetical protein
VVVVVVVVLMVVFMGHRQLSQVVADLACIVDIHVAPWPPAIRAAARSVTRASKPMADTVHQLATC